MRDALSEEQRRSLRAADRYLGAASIPHSGSIKLIQSLGLVPAEGGGCRLVVESDAGFIKLPPQLLTHRVPASAPSSRRSPQLLPKERW